MMDWLARRLDAVGRDVWRALPLIQVFGLRRGVVLAWRDRREEEVVEEVTAEGMPSVRCRLGRSSSDLRTYVHIFLDVAYEFPELRRSPGLIVDAGANIGCASVWFAERYAEATILAIEPDARNFELLKRNTAAYPRVHPILAALAPTEGSALVIDGGGGGHAIRAEFLGNDTSGAGQRAAVVDCVTLGELRAESGADRIDLLKLDIEGGEVEVLGDETGALLDVDAIVVELHDRFRPGCMRAYVAATQDFSIERTRGENTFAVR